MQCVELAVDLSEASGMPDRSSELQSFRWVSQRRSCAFSYTLKQFAVQNAVSHPRVRATIFLFVTSPFPLRSSHKPGVTWDRTPRRSLFVWSPSSAHRPASHGLFDFGPAGSSPAYRRRSPAEL